MNEILVEHAKLKISSNMQITKINSVNKSDENISMKVYKSLRKI